MVSVLYCYQFQHGIKITKKTRIFRYAFEFGAVDGSRTRYLQLGRLPLYQMSYYRRLRPFRNLCGGGWTRTTELRRGQIYSLLQLPLCDSPKIYEPIDGLEPPTG